MGSNVGPDTKKTWPTDRRSQNQLWILNFDVWNVRHLFAAPATATQNNTCPEEAVVSRVWFIASGCVGSYLLPQSLLLTLQMARLSRLHLLRIPRRDSDLYDSLNIWRNCYWTWEQISQTQSSGRIRLENKVLTKIVNPHFVMFCIVLVLR
jgi:hypothetical protein